MAAFIMSGPLQAIGFVLVFALLSMFLPFLGLLGNAAVGLVTLRLGWRRGLMVALPAGVMFGIVTLFLQGGLLGGLAAGVEWLIVAALAVLLMQTASWKITLQVIFGLAAVSVLLFHLNVPDPGAFWQAAIRSLITDWDAIQSKLAEVDLKELFDKAATYMTGMFAAGAALAFTLSLMLARHWQAALYNPGGFQQEMQELNLGKPAALLMAAIILFALLNGTPLMVDLLVIGLALFMFQGIAMVHGIRVILNVHPAWLFSLYIPLALLPVQLGILLAAFGIIDCFADFRGYLARRPKA